MPQPELDGGIKPISVAGSGSEEKSRGGSNRECTHPEVSSDLVDEVAEAAELLLAAELGPTPPPSTTVNITCRALDGRQTVLQVQADSSAAELVTRLVEAGFAQPGCRVLFISDDGIPTKMGERTISALGAGDGELLVLDPRVGAGNTVEIATPDLDDVNKEMIDEATSALIPSPPERTGEIPEASPEGFFLRQGGPQIMDVVAILLKISRSLQKALGNDSDSAAGDTAGPAEDAESDAELDPYADVDEDIVKTLSTMGFPEDRVKKALVLCGMDPEAAAEWLLVHMSDPDVDEPLPPPPKPVKNVSGSTFTPDPAHFRSLQGMGFIDKDIIAALQLSRNNFNAACDWLLGSEDVHDALAEQEKNAMDINNPLIQEALKNHNVQSGLVDPRVCKALEALAEDPDRGYAMFRHDMKVKRMIHVVMDLIKKHMHG